MIKVKEGDVICGACRLRNYKCRPCSDRQATCEHYVVSDDKDYQPPTKKAKEPMKKDINSVNLFPCKWESEITKKMIKVHHVLRSMLLDQDNMKMPLMRFRKSSSSDIQIRGKDSHYLYPCVFCTKRTKPKERRKLDGDNNKHIRKYLFKNFMIKVKEGDVICSTCRLRHYK
jgi:hypothetical protein